MSLLKNINDNFFNPFCCKNKEVYWECIKLLIETSKTVAVLYEQDAKDRISLYLENCQYVLETENIGEEISGQYSAQDNASAIIRYFRRCGWLSEREIGRSGDNIAAVNIYCRQLVGAIEKIFQRDANGAITNRIFSIYEVLRAALEKDSVRAVRPYTNVLEPLSEYAADLKNELLVLKDSIRTIMRLVMKLSDANSFGQFLLKDELLKRFFNDYFFIKRSGSIPVYLQNINRLLNKLRRSALVAKMETEYINLYNVDAAVAREHINGMFEQLDVFLNLEYENEMSYIDKKINTYYNLYSVRMMMVLGNSNNWEQQLNRLLLALKDMPPEERTEVLQKLSASSRLLSYGFVGRKSIDRRKRVKPNTKTVGLETATLSEEEKQRLTDELLKEYPDRYSLQNAAAYLENLLGDKDSMAVEDCPTDTRGEVMMLAAAIIYSGARTFPFQVKFRDGTLQTKIAAINKFDIQRDDR